MILLLFFFSKLTLDCPLLTPQSTSPWAACWMTSTGTRCSSSARANWSTSPWTSTGTTSTRRGSSVTWTWILRCDGYVSVDTSLRMCLGLSPANENTLLRTPLRVSRSPGEPLGDTVHSSRLGHLLLRLHLSPNMLTYCIFMLIYYYIERIFFT